MMTRLGCRFSKAFEKAVSTPLVLQFLNRFLKELSDPVFRDVNMVQAHLVQLSHALRRCALKGDHHKNLEIAGVDLFFHRLYGSVRQSFHLFRIDHVLGFYRIYAFPWRPQRNKKFLQLEWNEMLSRARANRGSSR